MKRLLMILVLSLMQGTASYLDSPGSVNNPAQWSGSAWYCVEGHYPNAYIVAGPFSAWVNCDAY